MIIWNNQELLHEVVMVLWNYILVHNLGRYSQFSEIYSKE